ncbi:MAG: hypothetical protein AAF528_00075 [Cyanobacteria bacterium P01_C01_bin.121]
MQADAPPIATPDPISRLAEEQTLHNVAPKSAPVKAVLVLDQTGSAQKHRIKFEAENLRPLFNTLIEVGGELAFFLICDEGEQPALRLRIPEPPLIKVNEADHLDPYVQPETDGNPFHLAEAQAEYAAQLKTNQTLIEQHRQILEDHQQTAKAELELFLQDLESFLNEDMVCPTTDLWGAIARADLILAEPTTVWSVSPTKYALFITDGIDTVGQPEVTFTSELEVILINGSGNTGIFSRLPHSRFESTMSALDHIVASVEQTTPQEGK